MSGQPGAQPSGVSSRGLPVASTVTSIMDAVSAGPPGQDLQLGAGPSDRHTSIQLDHNSSAAELDPNLEDQPTPGEAVLLFYLLLFLMIGTQTALFFWKKKHKRSYELVTLVGLWFMPAIFAVQLKCFRFFTVWCLFTIACSYLLYLCSKKKLESTTPRKVYTFFLVVYRVSTFLGMAGYVLILVEITGVGDLIRFILPKTLALTLVWYGLYFGVLGRDIAEVASDRMASSMGHGKAIISTVNHCGICHNELEGYAQLDSVPKGERVVQLSCKHCFHDLCVRGYCMVGKKDMCPVCHEKVDLRNVYADRPWETRNLSWIQMLDAVRYLVVWNPLIFLIFSLCFHLLGFDKHHHHSPLGPPGELQSLSPPLQLLGQT